MRSLPFAILVTSLVVATAFPSPNDPKLGAEYAVRAIPQPGQTAGR